MAVSTEAARTLTMMAPSPTTKPLAAAAATEVETAASASSTLQGSLNVPAPIFRVRLINIDHVVTFPGPWDRTESAFTTPGQPLRRVPVLRVFGATPAGQRVCAHIHGVFPYCFVQYDGSLEPDRVLAYIYRFGTELNAAIAASLRRDPANPDKAQFIAAIHLCKGVPFYGYHVGWRYFLKVSFTDPSQNVRIATILQSGRVMGTKMQPYEMHIRYNLQFMLDYNLFGCDYIDLADIGFRQPVPAADPYRSQDSSSGDEQRKQWTAASIPEDMIQSDQITRHSHCELEIDVHCADILNRRKLRRRDLHNTFNEKEDAGAGQKLVPSLMGLWEEEQMRRLNAGLSPTVPAPDTAGDQRIHGPDESPRWLASDRLEPSLQARVELERKFMKTDDKYRSNFTKVHPLDKHIVTVFDSVTLLHDVRGHSQNSVQGTGTYNVEKSSAPQGGDSIYNLEKSISQQSQEGDRPRPSRQCSSTSRTASGQDATRIDQHRKGKSRANGVDLISEESDKSEYEKTDLAFFSSQAFQVAMDSAERRAVPDSEGIAESDDEDIKPHSAVPQQAAATANAFTGSNGRRNGSNGDTSTDSHSGEKRSRSSMVPTLSSSSPAPSLRKKAKKESSQATTHGRASASRVRFAEVTVDSTKITSREAKRPFRTWVYSLAPPTRQEVENSFRLFGLPSVVHKDPYFSNPADVPKPREYAGRTFTFASSAMSYLASFAGPSLKNDSVEQQRSEWHRQWEYGRVPPSRLDVADWVSKRAAEGVRSSQARRRRFLSQRAAVTQPASLGFKLSQREPTSLVQRGKQHMTILAIEVLTCTRGKLFPDPAKDAVQLIAYAFQHEDEHLDDTGSREGVRTGLIVNYDDGNEAPFDAARLGIGHLAIEVVSSELDLFNALIDLVRVFDPEILVGYEIHSGSWGYLVERAMLELEYDIVSELGRVNLHNTGSRNDMWGATQQSSLRFSGRHTLNIWRMMRGELALNVYSYENVVFHLLRRRVPKYDFNTLTSWYTSGCAKDKARAILYWVERAEIDLEILDASELIFRTAEFARIYGVDFFSVISRGSQFKVESVMFRIAKPESYVLVSPSQQQVGQQNAAEDLPLILEPLSAFYKGPVLVLDFQSLYPSIMIAYNLCYSTCLGRVSKFRDTWKLGHMKHELPRGLLNQLQEDCFIAPNGILYAKSRVRKSLLSKMLTEILDTRVMVKGSVKGNKHDRAFVRLQSARQLSLKLLANVTYGYTSASFSGRMPCVEIADSIVRYGRETLERAIQQIHGTPHWGAQVVYGDTDSLFIYLENRSKDEAFKIGQDIADAVTAANPRPVKLKFEKVYLPSVLMAKKRYVGFMYETPSDPVPVFNAKGIETVRRDGFPAQQRMVEACIRILFRTSDLSQVKTYCQRQWLKILQGRISLQDFMFAKEVKLGSYSENGVPPPGAALAAKRMLLDKRNACQYGERVPYIISEGAGKARLVDLAREPLVMLNDRRQAINGHYYITRGLIPPLSRIFNLLGADVESWFRELPRVNASSFSLSTLMRDRQLAASAGGSGSNVGSRLLDHYRADVCLVCRRPSERDICLECREGNHPATTTHGVYRDLAAHQGRVSAIDRVCASCASGNSRLGGGSGHGSGSGSGLGRSATTIAPGGHTPCINIDCPMLYTKTSARDELAAREALAAQWEDVLVAEGEGGAGGGAVKEITDSKASAEWGRRMNEW